VAIH